MDHRNGNPRDNRRENLRVVTASQNQHNRRPRSRGVSGCHGVTRDGRATWTVRLRLNGKVRRWGSAWRSRYVAALVADGARSRLLGPDCTSNFPLRIAEADVRDFVDGLGGRFFKVVFSRRQDGRQRIMSCRTGVTGHLRGGGASYDPVAHELLVVWDTSRKDYRSIPVDRILCILANGRGYRVTHGPEVIRR